MDCLCGVGQKCVACDKKGEPSRDVPGSAWCAVHALLSEEERTRIWQERVMEQEEREQNAV